MPAPLRKRIKRTLRSVLLRAVIRLLSHVPLRAALAFVDRERAAAGDTGGTRDRPRLTRTVVWPEATLATDVELDGCIVAGAVRLRTGFRGRDAVIVPAAIVADGDAASVQDGVALFPLAQ